SDVLVGGAGNDYLIGGTGDDSLTGGPGNDTFGYLDRRFGDDIITDFSAGDRIDLSALNISSLEALRPFIRQVGADAVIELRFTSDRETITIQNVQAASLTAADFIFSTSPFALTVTGGNSQDYLFGGAGADRLNGLNSNDLLSGGGGSDVIDGGTGFDAALYWGVHRQYAASSTIVSGGPEGGADQLFNIEEARFVDGILTFDASSASAQIMRLYSATLNRTPDQAGLEANVAAMATYGLQGMASFFVGSAEFQARFGALANQQFVEQLYVFALGRAGDSGGVAAWVAALNGGATRGQVVVGFSESAENQGRTAATLNAGLWVPDAQAQIIARLYDATFDRLPDVGGLSGWTAALKTGTALVDIAAAFAGSAEFQARYGALSNQAFVEQLYRFCLNREGDAGGIAGWVAALNGGTSRASVLMGFSESAEHAALTAASWLGGIRYDGYVGAPVEDLGLKAFDDPQILPLDDDGAVYDPADLGLALAEKDDDAFVLPGEDPSLPVFIDAVAVPEDGRSGTMAAVDLTISPAPEVAMDDHFAMAFDAMVQARGTSEGSSMNDWIA
ncbi:MAG: DUF4214 domain-containing protein, partial [Alphaproteobacteria bacterium]|nr:DUF4214 domain-containing protein [Alphaproteobacteria bacterium]